MKKAMLAYKLDIDRVNYQQPEGYYIQPKLDGVRCLFTKHGAYSRNDKKFMNLEHIELDLIAFFQKYPNVVLDGELYNHKLKHDFEKIISLVRTQRPTAKDRLNSQHLVQFHVYDYFFENNHYDAYIYRLENLNFKIAIYNTHIKCVPTYRVYNHEEALSKHYYGFLKEGYEGSILRDGNALYKHGRSYGLMKLKDFSDKEATIIGYEEGKGKRAGTIGKFVMQDDEGIKFFCSPGKGYTYKDLTDMLINIKGYIGKRATFTYFKRTQAGSYRFPLFKTLRDYE